MKNNKFKTHKITIAFFYFLFVIILFSSCEKVINIDLNSKDSQIVIEASISNQSEPCVVMLTQTINYNESNNFPAISDATVVLSDNVGNIDTLIETSAGIYETSAVQGTVGRTYTLKVNVSGKEYTAISAMNTSVEIDSLYISTINLPNSYQKTLNLVYEDIEGIANYYRFIEIINSEPQSTIFIEDDLKQDGQTIDMTLLAKGQTQVKLKSGDMVTVQLQTIDNKVYDYFRTLLQLSRGGMINQSTSPANPLSNFNNGALGYFNAYAVTLKTIIVP